jgi:predicted component of type VI protein secretion system
MKSIYRVMKEHKILLCGVFVLMLLAGCSSSVTKITSKWAYAKDAIVVDVKADEELNLYNGRPHVLNIAIYQNSTPNGISQLLKTKNGLVSAMENLKALKGQTEFDRESFQPGVQKKITLNRAEGTQYVYLVFGYATEIVNRGSYLIPIPFDDGPQKLNISLTLGPTNVLIIEYTK